MPSTTRLTSASPSVRPIGTPPSACCRPWPGSWRPVSPTASGPRPTAKPQSGSSRRSSDMVDIAPPDLGTAELFGAAMRRHLERVEIANAATLDRVADRMLEVVQNDGLIYVAGTGHSIGSVLETFYRAGGLACVQPLYHPSLLPLHGGQESTLCEHLPGLGH